MLVSACLYLSSKINELEGRVRIRDFLNVVLYSIKEMQHFVELLKSTQEVGEVEDGIFIVAGSNETRHVINDYSRNQFRFMPTTSELSLLKVRISLF